MPRKKKRAKPKSSPRRKKHTIIRVDKRQFPLHAALLMVLFTLIFLFYPGNGYYQNVFSRNRDLFKPKDKAPQLHLQPVPYLSDPEVKPAISAVASYVVDLESFAPVFKKNPNQRLFPASTAKVITALVSFDAFNLDQELTVKRVVGDGQSMDLFEGEKMTFENLLYGLLVQSANDAAFVIADNFPGGLEKFVVAMNQKARELSMQNTQLGNPAGLDEKGQYTSAFDLTLAARELLKNRTLAKIVSTKAITVSDTDFKVFHKLSNVNKLLGEIAGVGGLKTGQTPKAGENLITFYKKNGNRFIIVILKSEDRFKDTRNIVEWIDANVAYIDTTE